MLRTRKRKRMDEAPKQDIYSSRGRTRRPDDDPLKERPAAPSVPPPRGFPVMLVLILLGFLAVLVGVVLYQRNLLLLTRQKARDQARAPVSVPEYPRPRVGLEFDPSGRMIFDEPAPSAPEALPASGVQTLTAHWIQQAAYHLRQAERAIADNEWRIALTNYEQVGRIVPAMAGLKESVGLCHLRLQSYEAAERVFAELAAAQPESAGLLNNLGVARMGLTHYADAEKDFLRALELKPDHAAARHNLGLLYFRSSQWEKAAGVLARIYRNTADNAELSLMYAVTLMRLDRWPQATAVLEESVQSPDAAAPVYFRLAEARSHTGDFAGAIKALQGGIDLVDQSTAVLWLNRSELDLLRNRPEFKKIVQNLARPP